MLWTTYGATMLHRAERDRRVPCEAQTSGTPESCVAAADEYPARFVSRYHRRIVERVRLAACFKNPLLSQALLAQPGGFEGLRLAAEALKLNDPALAESSDPRCPLVEANATPLAPGEGPPEHED